MRPTTLRALAAVALLAGAAGCGGSSGHPSARAFDPFSSVRETPEPGAPQRTAPRWTPVADVSGSASLTRPFAVPREAIQWRVRWRCSAGRLELADAAPTPADRLTSARCPGHGQVLRVRAGAHGLAVRATGPWRVTIDQQTDAPLHEPPLAGMRSPRARVIGRGSFRPIERKGTGTALLYRLPDHRLALRFENFKTPPIVDQVVWLSEDARPRTSRAALRSAHRVIAPLTASLGSQNYVLPAGTDARRIRSVVIWCDPQAIAYVTAPIAQ